MDTVTLTIDGRAITVEKGRTILEAALAHGIQIPFYCYHPGIGVDGSCRVCIVRVEKMPKLQTACSTMCGDGMVVHTNTPEVVAARASVFEFLLVNHPLDCPVCDKGGECPLQDYSYAFGDLASRMEFPRRVFDGEGVRADVDFGPTLLLNRNRCILCSRCVRFMKNVDGDAQINMVDRGYGTEIATFDERGVHSLLSGNLVDICPVGAITSRSYRFKSRPWDNPVAVDTICTRCAKGCSVTAWIKARPEWAKAPQLVRFTPRLNPDVNGYWMCDIGRFDFHWIEGDERLPKPLGRPPQGGGLGPTSWPDLMGRIREALAGIDRSAIRFLASAHASLEELFLVRRIAKGLGGANARVAVSWSVSAKDQPAGTKFPVPAINAPNVQGARDLGLDAPAGPGGEPDLTALRRAVEAGEVPALYVVDPGPPGSIGDISWIVEARHEGKLPLLIVQGVVVTDLVLAANLVLPGASSVEKHATYTNEQGRLQAASRVMAPPGDAMEDWQILVNLAGVLDLPIRYAAAAGVRADIAAAMAGRAPYAQIASVAFRAPLPARTWLQVSNPSERSKWDVLFRDLPPVKFGEEPQGRDQRSGARDQIVAGAGRDDPAGDA